MDNILLETGDDILLETGGSDFILLEIQTSLDGSLVPLMAIEPLGPIGVNNYGG